MAIGLSSQEVSSGALTGLRCVYAITKTVLSNFFSLPLLSPIVIASVATIYKLQIYLLKRQCVAEKSQLILLNMEQQRQNSMPVKRVNIADLKKFLGDEEVEEQRFLNELEQVQEGISKVLDFRCSSFNPIKTKEKRMELEDNVFTESPTELHRGLRNVFQYDHKHCGTDSKNGQLWKVWMEMWKAQAEAKKYRNVVEKLKEKLED